MSKDWGSIVEEEEEKGRRMQTRPKTNSRYYIICEMKQQLSPQKINGTCGITGLSIDIKYCKLACAK